MNGETTFLDEFNATAPDLSREVNVMVVGGSPEPSSRDILNEYLAIHSDPNKRFFNSAFSMSPFCTLILFKHGGKDAVSCIWTPYAEETFNLSNLYGTFSARSTDDTGNVSLDGAALSNGFSISGYYTYYKTTNMGTRHDYLYQYIAYYDGNDIVTYYNLINASTPYNAWNQYWVSSQTKYYRVNPDTFAQISQHTNLINNVSCDSNSTGLILSTTSNHKLVSINNTGSYITCVKNLDDLVS